MTITYDAQLLKAMALFENLTHAKLKDCYQDDVLNTMTFVVLPGESGKAIGKKGIVVKKLEYLFKKRIRVVEYTPEKFDFIRNLVQPLQIREITEDEQGIVTLADPDTKTKGLLIGRNGQNLRNLEKNVRRFFEVKEIRVV